MGHEITPEEIRTARDTAEILIASASNGRGSKKLVWRDSGFYLFVNGTLVATMTATVPAAAQYNSHDI